MKACIRFYIRSISIYTYIDIRIYIKYWKRIHISIDKKSI